MISSQRNSLRLLRSVALVSGLAFRLLGATGQAQQGAPPLVVTSAVPDSDGQTITIAGANFAAGRIGSRPFVTLDLIPLDVRVSTDSAILAAAPVGSMPAGEYLLTVSRGPAPADNATTTVTLGASSAAASAAVKPAVGTQPPMPAVTQPAAQVGDRTISIEDVDREWRQADAAGYLQMLRQLYEARRQVLNTMVTDELLKREAAARGVTVEAMLADEIPKHVIAMPDSAVTSLYLSLGDNARGASLDQMRPALRAWLAKHSEPELAKMSFIEELKKVSTRADVMLDAPRVKVERTAADIALGPTTAPVEIVAFGDFQSTAYAQLAESFARVRDTFGDRIRLSFKNLPVLGQLSVAAAEAGLCANAQGKFWAFHDALVKPGVVDAARLGQSATAAGVDRATFDRCVASGQFRDAIPRALSEAARYGIDGSPSVLLNGRLAPPPPPFLAPYDYLKLLVEEELARVAANQRP